VPANALRLGLTGGVGSGKSTAARIFQEMGASIIDADAISREVTAPGGAAIFALQSLFGSKMLTDEGALDRVRMRDLIYSNPIAKTQLERIVHPLVGKAISHQAHSAEASGAQCIVFDIPLLVESNHWRETLHRILVIDCSEASQAERVMTRSGLTLSEVQSIVFAQSSRAQRLKAADIIVFNDGVTIEEFAQQIRKIGQHFGL
jgi:dephospho-CoA kinase